MRRPNRSDEHLPPEEEAKREEETREYFEKKLPKRHPKPQRSDYPGDHNVDASIVDTSDQESSTSIPELDKLHRLEADPEKLVYDHGSAPVDDYVETEYYKDLNCIDKQHHTTGTGFIKVEMEKKDTGLINLLPYQRRRIQAAAMRRRCHPAEEILQQMNGYHLPTTTMMMTRRFRLYLNLNLIGVNLIDDMPQY